MKKLFLLYLLTLTGIFVINAGEANEQDYDLQEAWGNNTYLNISYNKTELSSKEFPTTDGVFSNEFKNKWGLGLQMGHTFNFHKKALGNVLFFGLDYNWIDLNFNYYEAADQPARYAFGEGDIQNMPWHHEKMTLSYGMSIGPALTLHPFTSLENKGANRIRLQAYFHVGYGVDLAMVKDVNESKENIFGHGLFTSFGGNLSWKFIGIGYELRNNSNERYKCLEKMYDTGKLKMKEKSSRFYLQFRF